MGLGCDLIHDIDWLVFEKRSQVRDHRFDQAHARFLGCPGNMGRHNTILCLQQRILEGRRLTGKLGERGTDDETALSHVAL